MRPPKGQRICIVMMSAVGDAVHVLPIINAIKHDNYASHITWVLQAGPASLVRGHPSVDEIVLFDRTKGVSAFLEVSRNLRKREFDLLIDLQVYFKAGIITAMSGAKRRLGFDRSRARDLNWLFTTDRIPPHPIQHVQDQYFEFLSALGIQPGPLGWNLGPWPHERAWQDNFVKSIDGPFASIVVATSKPEKDWLPERWAELTDIMFNRFGLKSVLVGGTSDREVQAADKIVSLSNSKPVSMLGSGLRNLVGILDASHLVLSPDTGPLHMTVAVGTPVISLIGYTDPRRTGPYRKFQDLIIDAFHDGPADGPVTMQTKSDGMSRITVADVEARLAIWAERYRAKS